MDIDKIGVLTEVSLELHCKEYSEEIKDYTKKEVDGSDIIIEREHLNLLQNFLNPNGKCVEIKKLLYAYVSAGIWRIETWKSYEEFSEFLKEFTRLYHQKFDLDFKKYPIYPDDEYQYHDYVTINQILHDLKLPFVIRYINELYTISEE